jgi:hypothetical protein
LLNDQENLDIESESINGGSLEYGFANVASEALDAALRITKVAKQDKVSQPVDHSAAQLSKSSCPNQRRCLVMTPASNNHIPTIL